VPVAFAQREDGAAGAEHFFPEMREGMRGGVGVDLDGFGQNVRFSTSLRLRTERFESRNGKRYEEEEERETTTRAMA
jgi:hypothetical protein